jgi:hypothetical protein
VRVRGRLLTENREGGWIETPCLASADLLLQLDADAAVRATAAEDTSSATEAPAVINDTESEPASHSFERDPHPLSTLDRVNAYVTEVTKRRGKRFLKREIWCQWYRAPSEFERWQRDDARTTHTARTRFEKVLKEKPHLR